MVDQSAVFSEASTQDIKLVETNAGQSVVWSSAWTQNIDHVETEVEQSAVWSSASTKNIELVEKVESAVCVLKDENLVIPRGQLLAIVEPVG